MRLPATLFFCAALGCFFAVPCAAQQNPHDLVWNMVQQEIKSQKHQNYWVYIDSNTQGSTTKVHRVVETPECWFQWLLSINGHPPSASEQAHNRAKIDRLVNDAGARQANRQKIDEDGKKAEALVRSLPNIFVYTNDGEENGNIRLKFRPNPKYNPPTREAQVFHTMEGTLLINKKEMRLAGISGTLLSDVTFGWGILGRLRKGGTFKVMQAELAPGDWEVMLLDVHIHGKALFFKTISEDQHEVKKSFEHVPPDLNLAQAAQLAEHGNQDVNASADKR